MRKVVSVDEAGCKIWQEAVEWARADCLATAYEESDKSEVIHALFGKSADMADKAKKDGDHERFKELKAYSEGLRHAINIMQFRGSALEAFSGIHKPGVKIDLTKDDLVMFGEPGH